MPADSIPTKGLWFAGTIRSERTEVRIADPQDVLSSPSRSWRSRGGARRGSRSASCRVSWSMRCWRSASRPCSAARASASAVRAAWWRSVGESPCVMGLRQHPRAHDTVIANPALLSGHVPAETPTISERQRRTTAAQNARSIFPVGGRQAAERLPASATTQSPTSTRRSARAGRRQSGWAPAVANPCGLRRVAMTEAGLPSATRSRPARHLGCPMATFSTARIWHPLAPQQVTDLAGSRVAVCLARGAKVRWLSVRIMCWRDVHLRHGRCSHRTQSPSRPVDRRSTRGERHRHHRSRNSGCQNRRSRLDSGHRSPHRSGRHQSPDHLDPAGGRCPATTNAEATSR